MANAILTAERLREVVDYDPATGIFTRKIRLAQRHHIGDRADFVVTGGNLKGYHRLSVDSKRYLAHRCAWLYVHGEWPDRDVDHINGNKGDNRIENLRDVSRRVNLQNLHNAKSQNKCGSLGVYFAQNLWYASVQHKGRRVYRASFATKELAAEAYLAAKRRIHEGCSI